MTISSLVLSRDDFTQALRGVGAQGYHDKHPFHERMHAGQLTERQLQAWIENRFYYQSLIPRKDALIVSRSRDQHFRQAWVQRLADQDGSAQAPGGLERWLVLGEAAGLDRGDLKRFRRVLPSVRFAVDGYFELVRSGTLLEAVASSLTELFAPAIMSQRLPAFEQHYPWVHVRGLEYFRSRLVEAPRDAAFGLAWVLDHATTRELQSAAISALKAKCQILWAVLDAIHFAYVEPGFVPPFFPTDS